MSLTKSTLKFKSRTSLTLGNFEDNIRNYTANVKRRNDTKHLHQSHLFTSLFHSKKYKRKKAGEHIANVEYKISKGE